MLLYYECEPCCFKTVKMFSHAVLLLAPGWLHQVIRFLHASLHVTCADVARQAGFVLTSSFWYFTS